MLGSRFLFSPTLPYDGGKDGLGPFLFLFFKKFFLKHAHQLQGWQREELYCAHNRLDKWSMSRGNGIAQ